MKGKLTPIASTLGKDERLKSRKLIQAVFASGKALSSYPLRAVYLFTESAISLQAGFTVSSRNFPRSVDRNRLKRLMRESYRLEKSALDTLVRQKALNLAVFFIYTGKEIAVFDVVNSKMRSILVSLVKVVEESPRT